MNVIDKVYTWRDEAGTQFRRENIFTSASPILQKSGKQIVMRELCV